MYARVRELYSLLGKEDESGLLDRHGALYHGQGYPLGGHFDGGPTLSTNMQTFLTCVTELTAQMPQLYIVKIEQRPSRTTGCLIF